MFTEGTKLETREIIAVSLPENYLNWAKFYFEDWLFSNIPSNLTRGIINFVRNKCTDENDRGDKDQWIKVDLPSNNSKII